VKIFKGRKFQRGNLVVTVGGDPLFSNVKFLMSAEEAPAGSVAIIPTVGPSMNWSLQSGTQPAQVDGFISAARFKYGAQSLYYKESGGAPNAGWASDAPQVGTVFGFIGDFTVECDIYILDKTSVIELCGLWDFNDRQWRWSLEAGNGRMNFQTSSNGVLNATPVAQHDWGGQGVPSNAWHHIALCRAGNNWYAWLDGVASSNGTIVSAQTINTPANAYFVIGQSGFQDGAGFVEANVDNLRITDGVARYVVPFTPPTEPHPAF